MSEMKDMSEQMKERISKWLEQLSEDEKSQTEVLDAYFTFRLNLPEKESALGKVIEDYKTTDDIMDDLLPMMIMDKNVVVGWMRAHDFHITTVGDGTPKWAIWRYINEETMT